MPPSRRAKQFAMFDALKGLKEAIAAKERPITPRKELSEERVQELNRQLLSLEKGQLVTLVYYGAYEQQYLQVTGTVTRIDAYWGCIQVGQVTVDFGEIFEIIL